MKIRTTGFARPIRTERRPPNNYRSLDPNSAPETAGASSEASLAGDGVKEVPFGKKAEPTGTIDVRIYVLQTMMRCREQS